MNPFARIKNWKRKNFADYEKPKDLREWAEIETSRDLHKPAQQLLCDVHEEVLNDLPPLGAGETADHHQRGQIILQLQRLLGAQKRSISLQAVSAHEASRTNAWIFWLTAIVVIQGLFTLKLMVIDPPAFNPQLYALSSELKALQSKLDFINNVQMTNGQTQSSLFGIAQSSSGRQEAILHSIDMHEEESAKLQRELIQKLDAPVTSRH